MSITPSRAQVSALTPEQRTEAAIHAAVEACDYVQAAAIVLARALAGEDVAAEVIATILPGVRDEELGLALLGLGSGDRAAVWLGVVQCGAFPPLSSVGDVEAITLYVAWKLGADRAGLLKEARRLSRYSFSFSGMVLLDALTQALDDPTLATAIGHLRVYGKTAEGKRVLRDFEAARVRPTKAYVATLPAETATTASVQGFTVRVAPRAGRNEPCPCGSGQKYKRCCADKDAQVAPSPVSGLSWDAYVTTAADRMTAEDVQAFDMRDLARVNLTQLETTALVSAMRRFGAERLWNRAASAVDALSGRKPDDASFESDHRTDLVSMALEAGQLDFAEAQLARITDVVAPRYARLEVALRRRRPEAFDMLAQMVESSVRAEDTIDMIDIAHAVIHAAPALGIVLARSCLSAAHPLDNETLLESIEDARDELGMPAGDPAWETFDSLEEVEEEADDEEDDTRAAAFEDAVALRSSLRDTASRVEELERQLTSAKDRLAAKPERTVAAPDRDEERRLRMKIEELQGLVREGNSERGDLRRQLMAVNAAARDNEAPEATQEEEGDELESSERQVAIPSLTRRFLDSLEGVPQTVAAEAMRTIGALAAGDQAAWRGIKAARDMKQQVLMRRIGIHHRLLFRAEARTLEVLDLITRENLLTTLKRLR